MPASFLLFFLVIAESPCVLDLNEEEKREELLLVLVPCFLVCLRSFSFVVQRLAS